MSESLSETTTIQASALDTSPTLPPSAADRWTALYDHAAGEIASLEAAEIKRLEAEALPWTARIRPALRTTPWIIALILLIALLLSLILSAVLVNNVRQASAQLTSVYATLTAQPSPQNSSGGDLTTAALASPTSTSTPTEAGSTAAATDTVTTAPAAASTNVSGPTAPAAAVSRTVTPVPNFTPSRTPVVGPPMVSRLTPTRPPIPVQPGVSSPTATSALRTSLPTATRTPVPPTNTPVPPTRQVTWGQPGIIKKGKIITTNAPVYKEAERLELANFFLPLGTEWYLCNQKQGSYQIAQEPCDEIKGILGWVNQKFVYELQ